MPAAVETSPAPCCSASPERLPVTSNSLPTALPAVSKRWPCTSPLPLPLLSSRQVTISETSSSPTTETLNSSGSLAKCCRAIGASGTVHASTPAAL